MKKFYELRDVYDKVHIIISKYGFMVNHIMR